MRCGDAASDASASPISSSSGSPWKTPGFVPFAFAAANDVTDASS